MSEMKIGIAVPCHTSDVGIYQSLMRSVSNLQPQPYKTFVRINSGEGGMRRIVSSIFDCLFEVGCDVVLKASADFYLFPHILRYVDSNQVVTFTPLTYKPYDLTFGLHRVLLPQRTWSGCYSVPSHIWYGRVREAFDGHDTSVAKAVGHWKVKSFQYVSTRPYREEATKRMLRQFPLWKRILWQFVRMKAMRL